MSDEIVKVKKSDLERLIDANTEAYRILDNLGSQAEETATAIKDAYRALEDAPSEMSEIIIEEEGEE
jgi:hypothetical protein